MVAWLLDQKHHVHTYQVDWPGNPTQINVEPKNLWTDQGHESNGLAVYGFFLGIFGMLTAWRMRNAGQAPRSLTALTTLLLIGTMFSLSAFIFVFVVTYQTTGQRIREPIAINAVGLNYPAEKWTPETWFRAILDLPLADGAQHAQIKSRVRNMEAWRWILLPLLLVYITASYIVVTTWLRQRRNTTVRASSAGSVEKTGAR
ncbi:hypothetical protein AG0111_0g1222 [Alternaria gaisen]|uniref:Uncharacterized protein n=1 Tax=Alternaria gaisen TaxID=167740 RepID=A0ACB6G094_9PLEO|nr:hypothetical protein AG0111_0g1222 [Alternaria gaisen]